MTLSSMASVAHAKIVTMSDQCPRHPNVVYAVLLAAVHKTLKGRRGCVGGRGELKDGGETHVSP